MPENKTEERPPQLDNVRDNATQEDFKMKNKVWEMLEYAGPQLEEFGLKGFISIPKATSREP